MLPSDTESLSPPPLRTATTSTDTNWPLATLSASLTLVLPALSSRGLSSTPATARGPLSPSTEEWLSTLDTRCLPLTGLFRVSALDMAMAMGSTAMARGPLSPSTEEWLSTLDMLCLPLRGLLRVSALDTATDTGSTATARGPLSLSTGQQLLLRTTITST